MYIFYYYDYDTCKYTRKKSGLEKSFLDGFGLTQECQGIGGKGTQPTNSEPDYCIFCRFRLWFRRQVFLLLKTRSPNLASKLVDSKFFAINETIKIQIVNSFPDVKLQRVDSVPDFEIYMEWSAAKCV